MEYFDCPHPIKMAEQHFARNPDHAIIYGKLVSGEQMAAQCDTCKMAWYNPSVASPIRVDDSNVSWFTIKGRSE